MSDYPVDFLAAVNDLLDNWERGYVDDPGDSGGETKYGISKRWHADLDIKNLTRDHAIDIYYHDYWMQLPISTEPVPKAKVFNMAVLIGRGTAVRLIAGCPDLDAYKKALMRYFEALAYKNPQDGKFLHGWIRRVLA